MILGVGLGRSITANSRKMYVLGISCFYHDSSATLIKDGEVIAAAQEERFTRRKHDQSFPVNAVGFCLSIAGISIEAIDYIGFYEKPLVKFERILYQHLQMYPRSFWSFYKAMPSWLTEKLRVMRLIRKKLKYKGDVFFLDHHLSHAASRKRPNNLRRNKLHKPIHLRDDLIFLLWELSDDLEHIETDSVFLSEIYCVLKKGGTEIFSTLIKGKKAGWESLHEKNPQFGGGGHVREGYSEDALETLLKEKSFKIEEKGHYYNILTRYVPFYLFIEEKLRLSPGPRFKILGLITKLDLIVHFGFFEYVFIAEKSSA